MEVRKKRVWSVCAAGGVEMGIGNDSEGCAMHVTRRELCLAGKLLIWACGPWSVIREEMISRFDRLG